MEMRIDKRRAESGFYLIIISAQQSVNGVLIAKSSPGLKVLRSRTGLEPYREREQDPNSMSIFPTITNPPTATTM